MASFAFKRGDDLEVPCLEEADGAPVNLTGYTLRAQLRSRSKGELVDEMTVTLGDQGTAPGTFTLTVAKARTALWEPDRVLEFDVEYTSPAGLPRVAALPGSPTQGDAVVLTTDGLLYVYDGTAWVAGGVTSRELGGVLSTDLADYYESASPLCPGANDFIVVTLAVPVTTRNGAKHEPLVGCYSTSPLDGWWIAWDYTQLSAAVGQGASHYPAAIPTANWDSQRKLGQLHAIGLRAYGGGLGSTLQIELWVGPAVHATATGSADVDVDPGATNPLRIMAGTYYGDESAANAIFAGLGYYEGTVTTAQMRRIMGRALAQAEIPEDLLAWDYVLQGRDGQTAPTTWSPSVGAGNLTKNGGPAATTGLFPPGASASTPVVLPGGGSGLSDYETRRRILLLG